MGLFEYSLNADQKTAFINCLNMYLIASLLFSLKHRMMITMPTRTTMPCVIQFFFDRFNMVWLIVQTNLVADAVNFSRSYCHSYSGDIVPILFNRSRPAPVNCSFSYNDLFLPFNTL